MCKRFLDYGIISINTDRAEMKDRNRTPGHIHSIVQLEYNVQSVKKNLVIPKCEIIMFLSSNYKFFKILLTI